MIGVGGRETTLSGAGLSDYGGQCGRALPFVLFMGEYTEQLLKVDRNMRSLFDRMQQVEWQTGKLVNAVLDDEASLQNVVRELVAQVSAIRLVIWVGAIGVGLMAAVALFLALVAVVVALMAFLGARGAILGALILGG